MKRGLRVLLMQSLALYFLSQPAAAQDPATGNPKVPSETDKHTDTQADESSLKNVLHLIEERFNVSIAYKSNIVKDRNGK